MLLTNQRIFPCTCLHMSGRYLFCCSVCFCVCVQASACVTVCFLEQHWVIKVLSHHFISVSSDWLNTQKLKVVSKCVNADKNSLQGNTRKPGSLTQ